jgi:hypothetical protein
VFRRDTIPFGKNPLRDPPGCVFFPDLQHLIGRKFGVVMPPAPVGPPRADWTWRLGPDLTSHDPAHRGLADAVFLCKLILMSLPIGVPLVSMVKISRAREFFFSQGMVPHGLISETIVRSWERSAAQELPADAGICANPPCSGEHLAARQEKCRDLLRHSLPVMENLYEQIIHTSSMVLLTDAGGVVLHSIGDPGFVGRADKVSLKPGGVWAEGVRGTNAIGTALVEEAPVVVHSAEHYVAAHHFLTCSASPIFDPHGRVLGVLDVSTDSRRARCWGTTSRC